MDGEVEGWCGRGGGGRSERRVVEGACAGGESCSTRRLGMRSGLSGVQPSAVLQTRVGNNCCDSREAVGFGLMECAREETRAGQVRNGDGVSGIGAEHPVSVPLLSVSLPFQDPLLSRSDLGQQHRRER